MAIRLKETVKVVIRIKSFFLLNRRRVDLAFCSCLVFLSFLSGNGNAEDCIYGFCSSDPYSAYMLEREFSGAKYVASGKIMTLSEREGMEPREIGDTRSVFIDVVFNVNKVIKNDLNIDYESIRFSLIERSSIDNNPISCADVDLAYKEWVSLEGHSILEQNHNVNEIFSSIKDSASLCYERLFFTTVLSGSLHNMLVRYVPIFIGGEYILFLEKDPAESFGFLGGYEFSIYGLSNFEKIYKK